MIDNVTFNVKKTKITKKQIIRETARKLDCYTQDEVKQVYDTIRDVIGGHLEQANDDNFIHINLGNGLSLSAKIKYICGYPRIWYSARFTRYRNRVLNELV